MYTALCCITLALMNARIKDDYNVIPVKLFGVDIKISNADGFICIKDILIEINYARKEAGRMGTLYYRWSKGTNAGFFVESAEDLANAPIKRATTGRFGSTWVSPIVFLKFIMTMCPTSCMEVSVFAWLLIPEVNTEINKWLRST